MSKEEEISVEEVPADETSDLERKADAVRERLAKTLSRIDTRRRAYTDPGLVADRARSVVSEHKPQLGMALLAAFGVAGAIAGVAVVRARRRRSRLMQRRLEAAIRAWKNPDDLVPARASFVATAVRNLLMAALGTAARRLVADMMPALPEARPVEKPEPSATPESVAAPKVGSAGPGGSPVAPI